MNFLAVATNQDDEAVFYKGRHIKNAKAKFVRQRKELQHKGTRSAKRKLKQVAGRENRFMTDVNHQVANEMIAFAKRSDPSLLSVASFRLGKGLAFSHFGDSPPTFALLRGVGTLFAYDRMMAKRMQNGENER